MIETNWTYFLAAEEDFIATSRYVEITPDNYKVYSIEYAKILQTVTSEVDAVCKMFCDYLEPDILPKRPAISDYQQIITYHFPKFHSLDISLDGYKIMLQPWQEWNSIQVPFWWKAAYNVKHGRHLSYKEANLENTLNALAALMGLLLYVFKKYNSHVPLVFPKLMDSSYFPTYMIIEDGRSLPDFV